MVHRLAAITLTVLLTTAFLTAAQRQSAPPVQLPPPPETSVYELLDVGATPVAGTCPCISRPFTLPENRPGWGYGTGPGTPLHDARVAPERRDAIVKLYADERRLIAQDMEQGREGNGNASFAVALHLALAAVVFAPDPQNEREVVRWLQLAAQQHHQDAPRLLGYRFARGRGVAQDYRVAAGWFYEGVRYDDPISMTALGLLYAGGYGVNQSWPAAVRLWKRAEDRSPFAARFLGDAYVCGLGVEQDFKHALALYKKSAERDYVSAVPLGQMYANGCGGSDGDERRAYDALEKAAQQGDPEAQIALSDLIREGRGTEPVPLQAYLWARLAELRLPDGDLRKAAAARAKAAAAFMSEFEMSDTDRFVASMLADAAKPIR